MDDLYAQIEQARAAIAARVSVTPRVALILGSGLGSLADELDDPAVVPYAEVPGFPRSTVHGHRGELGVGRLGGQPVAVMRGRFHFYEGYTMQQVTFPVRVLRALGCDTLIVTNACGGLRPDWAIGDLMQIADQIFLPGMAGHHPLIGPNDERLGPRFPDMTTAYDPALRVLAARAGKDIGLELREGVYAAMAGPQYETPAEIRMLRTLGADLAGMSTVPEVIAAAHQGARVLGLSCCTNLAAGISPHKLSHAEVTETAARVRDQFAALLGRVLDLLAEEAA